MASRTGHLRIEFAVTPRFDVFYALYAVTSETTPLETWKERAVGRLPDDFRQLASRVAPLPIFWPLLADALQSVSGALTFDAMLSSLRELPAAVLQRNVLAGIFHDSDTVDALVAREKTLKQVLGDKSLTGVELLTHFGLGPATGNSVASRAMSALLSNPELYRDELVAVLQRFWQNGFSGDWTALEPALHDESLRMRELRDDSSASQLARELNLPVGFDDAVGQVRSKSGTAIPYAQINRCYIVPSAFNTRRWWAKYESGAGEFTLYFPVLSDVSLANQTRARSAAAPKRSERIDAESVFRALGDTTRYAIASILARTPTSSADLARSLKVSKPTITHHVQALRSAGLIRETPSGGSTKLSLSRDTVAALSGAAVEQLFSSTGDLTLGTTRKRRSV